jgi:hypothetical protein
MNPKPAEIPDDAWEDDPYRDRSEFDTHEPDEGGIEPEPEPILNKPKLRLVEKGS